MPETAADILVVDDNPSDCGLALVAFQRESPVLHVITMESGAEALDYLYCRGDYERRTDRTLPKLVILDINMPEMSGLDVLRAIRSDPRTAELVVIILTGSYDPNEIEQSVKLGATSYFIKPVDLHEYIEMLRVIRRNWLSPR
ncbi:MAG TPA: response regulator [Burkholderiales bacterium]|nr:response regulator [Burkholderiales bacterium]